MRQPWINKVFFFFFFLLLQCVKDFPAVLLALYKRGRAILF